ncbi:PEP/pyruvate-binding domain-containing protein [Haloarchaeobius sp. HRN-SO-5]|uniref:PEP/pyruvate-binding domain-containing protein n=1 Tax=Haloarchaeobius sp. HRN-SO-5 TaxID=3446118 RepID=UPI003EBA0A77
MTTPAVLALDDDRAADPETAGSKAATLARLRGAGLPVPDGFVVTTDTYRTLVDDPETRGLLAALDEAIEAGDDERRDRTAADVRERIESRPLPDDVVEGVEDHLGEGAYAVRSSGTAEDLPGTSFAGQYETVLDVSGRDEVLDAVRTCLASLFTDRAVAYRARNGIPTADAAMAVVVQRFVDPESSGILFTADPVTGDRTVSVVDAGPGRGDTQVAGLETADTLRVDSETGDALDYRLAPGRSERVLSDGDVAALVDLGARVSAVLDGPQDVEWAIVEGDEERPVGEVVLLQSRPVTALFPLPEPRPTDDRLHVYYSFGYRQGMPEAMPPLVLDVWRRLIDTAWEQYGLTGRFAAMAGGRLYIDLTPYLVRPWLGRRIRSTLRSIDEPAAEALSVLVDERGDDLPWSGWTVDRVRRTAGTLVRVAPTVGRVLGRIATAFVSSRPEGAPDRARVVYEANCRSAVRRIRSHDAPEGRVRAAVDELEASVSWLLDEFYPFYASMLAGSALGRLRPGQADDVARLASGIRDDPVRRMGAELDDLADVARDDPAVVAALRDGASLDDLASVSGSGPFLDAFEAFLDEYGFRAAAEIDFSRPRYREDPTLLLNAVAGHLESGGGPDERAATPERTADEAARSLVDGANPLLRPLVRRLVRVYSGYLGLREYPKYALSKLLAELRTQVQAAGEHLAATPYLADAEDVWFLDLDELLECLADPSELAAIGLPARRRSYERHRRTAAPRIVTSDGYVPPSRHREPASSSTLTGTAAAPGVVEGVVRVVTDPGTERLERGEVLVAPYTDPGWTPLFLNAAAVVTAVGGRLTHGSLVAREYGIPAVVAVEDATTRLRTGERVRVDGTRGVVERLDYR